MPEAPRAGAVGWACIACERPGKVASSGSSIDVTKLERPLICGFSDGGMIATVLGIRYPEVPGAIVNHGGYDLFNPDAPSMMMARQMFAGGADATEPDFDAIAAVCERVPPLARMFGRMQRDYETSQQPEHWKIVFARIFPRISRPSGYTFDDLARVAAPTLILVGDRDQFCSMQEGARAFRVACERRAGRATRDRARDHAARRPDRDRVPRATALARAWIRQGSAIRTDTPAGPGPTR